MVNLKIKYIDGSGWDWLDTYACHIKKVDGYMKGTISIVYDTKVTYPLTVDYETPSKTLFNDGFKCVTFLPDKGNWCVNAVYNEEDVIVEWYFDILKSKGVDLSGRHYYKDLYLDVVVRPDYQIRVIDGDELLEALNDGIINREDFDGAYEIADHITKVVVKDKAFMEEFLSGYLPRKK